MKIVKKLNEGVVLSDGIMKLDSMSEPFGIRKNQIKVRVTRVEIELFAAFLSIWDTL